MFCLGYKALCFKKKRRKDYYNGNDAENNTFSHYKTQIPAECELHKAERKETENSGKRRTRERRECFDYCLCHSGFTSIVFRFFLPVPIHKKYGIVHRDSELQNCRNSLSHERNLTENPVSSHIVKNSETQSKKKYYGQEERIHRKHQRGKRE